MRSSYDRWYSAYTAYQNAKSESWKALWLGVMKHFQKEFN